MSRFFAKCTAPGEASLSGEDLKHLKTVLRLKIGDAVTLCDGSGLECGAVLKAYTPEEALFAAGPWARADSEPLHSITLFQCLPKTGKMETILQKCTELGLCALTPVLSERCVMQPGKDFDKKTARYEKVAKEASQQSGRGRIPAVNPLCALRSLSFSGFDRVLCAYEGEKDFTLKQALRASSGLQIALVVGPEGGFSMEEIALLRSRGAQIVTLGKRILRTETAGMAMLAEILYELEG